MKEKLKQKIAELEPKAKALYEEYCRLTKLRDDKGTEWMAVYNPLQQAKQKLVIIEEMEAPEAAPLAP